MSVSHATLARIVLAAAVALSGAACALRDALERPAAPTTAAQLFARDITVRIERGAAMDAVEQQRLADIKAALTHALPSVWRNATQGLGRLTVSSGRADITITLVGTSGQSVFQERRTAHRVVSRAITIHTIWAGRRLGTGELLFVALHELGHIWCCYGPGTSGGHWTDQPQGLMNSVAECEWIARDEVTCDAMFSERELVELGLLGRR